MSTLTIDLQDGFHGDTVVLTWEGREVLRAEGVKTRFQTGLARSEAVDLDAPRAVLRVEVPTRGLETSVGVDLTRPAFLGISLTPEGALRCRASDQPFGYL